MPNNNDPSASSASLRPFNDREPEDTGDSSSSRQPMFGDRDTDKTSGDTSSNTNGDANDGTDGSTLPKPQIEIIVDGNSIFKPGMKTFFVPDGEKAEGIIGSDSVIGGEFCTCDVVYTWIPGGEVICVCDSHCSCQNVCSCDNYSSCSCVNHTSSCSCVGHSSTVCSCQSVSCGSPCACVPVH